MLRDLFAEGALSTAFVTTFSRKIATEGRSIGLAAGEQDRDPHPVFMSVMTLLGILFAPIWSSAFSRPAFLRKGAADRRAHADHVSVHPPGFAGCARHGNAERETRLRHAGDGSSFFNLGSIVGGVGIGWWLDPHGLRPPAFASDWWGSRSERSSAAFCSCRCSYRPLRASATSFRADFAWRDRACGPSCPDGAGRDRGQRGAGECADQQRLRLRPQEWSGQLAQYRVSPDAACRSVSSASAVATVTLPLVSRSAALAKRANFAAPSRMRCGRSCCSRSRRRSA